MGTGSILKVRARHANNCATEGLLAARNNSPNITSVLCLQGQNLHGWCRAWTDLDSCLWRPWSQVKFPSFHSLYIILILDFEGRAMTWRRITVPLNVRRPHRASHRLSVSSKVLRRQYRRITSVKVTQGLQKLKTRDLYQSLTSCWRFVTDQGQGKT